MKTARMSHMKWGSHSYYGKTFPNPLSKDCAKSCDDMKCQCSEGTFCELTGVGMLHILGF